MDRAWWDVHLQEVNNTFRGVRYSNNPLSQKYNVRKLNQSEFKTYGNSGASCISLAAAGGAKKVILLGFDCQKTDNKTHWHGDHPPTLGNAGQISRWHDNFALQAKALHGKVEVINCSRQTALKCYPRAELEEILV
jgi:hypothetical protein